MRVLVTGGAGFIGSAVIRRLVAHKDIEVLNIDKLSYAASPDALKPVEEEVNYTFKKVNICDRTAIDQVVNDFEPHRIIHLAAETHVDRSIGNPRDFIDSNIVGTFNLLEASRNFLQSIRHNNPEHRFDFRFIHVSTDEVYGELDFEADPFVEESQICPSSPYSASKAASDHLVNAWARTYGIPAIITHCSNNYGSWQYPEKLIPLFVKKAIQHQPLPVYGKGNQIRDWLHVDDHAAALHLLLTQGRIGKSYNLGGNNEMSNMELVKKICLVLSELDKKYGKDFFDYTSLIEHVEDRLGHDKRYAINCTKAEQEFGWRASIPFEQGFKETIEWFYQQYS